METIAHQHGQKPITHFCTPSAREWRANAMEIEWVWRLRGDNILSMNTIKTTEWKNEAKEWQNIWIEQVDWIE